MAITLTPEQAAILAEEEGYVKPKRRKAPSSDKYSVLKNVPTVICEIARQEFPEARSNTDAVIAYLVTFCPAMTDNNRLRMDMLTEEQQEMVRNHKDNLYTTVSDRMLQMNGKVDRLSRNELITQSVVLYLLYDRMGLREANIDPSTMEGLDADKDSLFMDFYHKMEEMFKRFRSEKENLDNRPGF